MTTTPPTPKASLHLNWEDWLPYFEDADLTVTEKREMIETLWSIVIAFVDLGWDISDAPQKTGGQVLDLRAALTAAVVNSKEQEKEEV